LAETFEASSGGYPLVSSISTEQLRVIKKIKARIVVSDSSFLPLISAII